MFEVQNYFKANVLP